MKEPVKKKCQCGHLEIDHKYRSESPETLLNSVAKQQNVEVIRSPDHMEPLGYKLIDGTYFTHEKALADIEHARKNSSYCVPNVFDKTCECKVYRADNLKYLEDLNDECSAS
jgi:hypothetical protein